MRFRRKPNADIEAWQNTLSDPMPAWVTDAIVRTEDATLIIATLEGHMSARLNDWIIRGVKGEVYSCKPDIFDMIYEPAND